MENGNTLQGRAAGLTAACVALFLVLKSGPIRAQNLDFSTKAETEVHLHGAPEGLVFNRDKLGIPENADLLINSTESCKKPATHMKAKSALLCHLAVNVRRCMHKRAPDSDFVLKGRDCVGRHCVLKLDEVGTHCFLKYNGMYYEAPNATHQPVCGLHPQNSHWFDPHPTPLFLGEHSNGTCTFVEPGRHSSIWLNCTPEGRLVLKIGVEFKKRPTGGKYSCLMRFSCEKTAFKQQVVCYTHGLLPSSEGGKVLVQG